jgi:integrase/recombinase XerD
MTRRVCGPLDGPLQPYGVGFEARLAGEGYSADSVSRQLRLMVHLSRWLDRRRLGPGDLTSERARQFLRSRKAAGYAHPVSMAGLAPLLGHLREVGAAPSIAEPELGPLDVVVSQYRAYLLEERGLSERTSVARYVEVARGFLSHRGVSDPSEFRHLTGGEVSGFVLAETRRCSVGTAKTVITRLRAFLRYLEVAGLTSNGLVGAVPSVASWQLTGVPQGITADQVSRLLDSCDRSRPIGRRDFAILTVLSRLGLRAAEAAALQVTDIDWRAGEISVRGKGNRHDKLPLPWDVGEAIACWLQDGRPSGAGTAVFTRVLAPHRGLSDRAVSGVVRQACQRAGLAPSGSHRLRHTVATETLRAGGEMAEIAQLLRHRSLAATSIYAKVDRHALSVVAQPWPGAES